MPKADPPLAEKQIGSNHILEGLKKFFINMNLKIFWNNRPYWQKGMLIGFFASFVLAVIFSVLSYFNFLQNPSIEAGCLYQKDCMLPFYFVFLGFLIYVIPASALGAILGFFVGKLHSDNDITNNSGLSKQFWKILSIVVATIILFLFVFFVWRGNEAPRTTDDSTVYPIGGSYPLRKENLTETRILETANEAARTHNIDLAEYQTPSAEYDSENKKWLVFYVMKPPTPPGGHFSVMIDDATGEAEFQPGI